MPKTCLFNLLRMITYIHIAEIFNFRRFSQSHFANVKKPGTDYQAVTKWPLLREIVAFQTGFRSKEKGMTDYQVVKLHFFTISKSISQIVSCFHFTFSGHIYMA